MERQLFNWTDWEELGFMILYFYGCTFNKKVGKYNKGDKVEGISVDYSRGTMKIYEDPDSCITYKLSLLVNES